MQVTTKKKTGFTRPRPHGGVKMGITRPRPDGRVKMGITRPRPHGGVILFSRLGLSNPIELVVFQSLLASLSLLLSKRFSGHCIPSHFLHRCS